MATKTTTSKLNKKRNTFYAYIVECADTTLYIGSTNDLNKRIHQHNHAKNGAKYTKARRPVILRYSEILDTFAASRTREARLKRLSRKEKMALFIGK